MKLQSLFVGYLKAFVQCCHLLSTSLDSGVGCRLLVTLVLFPSDTGEIETVAMKSTPVGPVAGGIMGCFLLLALGVYCYRHHVHRHAHQYVSTLPDNPHRGSHYYNDEEPDGLDDTTAGWCITSIVSGVGGAGGKT